MTNQQQFLGRDTYRLNYHDEPGKVLVNPNPGIRGYRYPKEFYPNVENLAYPGMNDEQVMDFLIKNYYEHPRKLADGSWVALYMLATTWSVCTDITKESPYAYRWCFTDKNEAMYFLDTIEEFDEIPTRTQSLRGHRFDGGFARVIHYDKDGYRKW